MTRSWSALPAGSIALLVSGSVAVPVVVVVAGARPAAAVLVAALVSGTMAIGTGVVVAAGSGRRPLLARRPLRLLAVAMVVWGVGQLLVGWAANAGPATYPTTGDQVSALAAPVAIVGLLATARVSSQPVNWVRLALDATVLGCAGSLMIWVAGFRSVLLVDGLHPSDALSLTIIVVEACLASLLTLAWLRELDRGLLLAGIGFLLYAAADLWNLHEVVQRHVWPWPAAVMWCLAWPMIGAGLLRLQPGADRGGAARGSDVRVAATSAAASAVATVAAVLLLWRGRTLDAVSVSVVIGLVLAVAAREGYAALQRQDALATLLRHAMEDPLTGLPNRRAMTSRLDALSMTGGSVLTLDLDAFKDVNDVLGHSAGDALLRAVSQRLRADLPVDVDVFRVGGDEFVVTVPGGDDRGGVVAHEVLDAVRRACDDLPGMGSVGVSASVGHARLRPRISPAADRVARDQVLQVLAESGAALHAAKASGRARVERYDGCVADAHRRALLVERRLRDTLSGAGLAVHYQPVVDLATGAVNGFEALARWDDVVLGTVTPDEFVPVAERTGLIGELGRQVMTRALADLVAMADTVPGGRRLRMAVNVSPVQLRTQSFAAEVQQLVADSGVAAHRVVVEVTEAVFVSENEAAVRQLHELRAYGLQVAIDDFGSGYSSLGYLSRLPATILKVDRSMTAHVTTDGRARTVMRSVVDLGASLPMQVAVEGIETAAMHRLVRGLGATHGQGWLYAPAVPLDRVAETLASIAERRADWDLAVPLQPAVGD